MIEAVKWPADRPLMKLWVRLAMDKAVPSAEGTHTKPAESFSKRWAIVWEAGRRTAFIWSESGCSGLEASCSFPTKRVDVEPQKESFGVSGSLPRIGTSEKPTTVHPQEAASTEASPKLSYRDEEKKALDSCMREAS